MRIVIAGGHGKIALRLERLLRDAGDEPVGIIRRADQTADLTAAGAESVVLDLENTGVDELAEIVQGAGAVVFAAGAGPGSGAARKLTVDRNAAGLLADAASVAGVRRYVMVSAMRVDEADPDSDEVFQVYLRAKAAADEDLRGRDLDWTIIRPGRLTDEPGTGLVELGDGAGYGEIPRDDVATLVHGALREPSTVGKQFAAVGGDTPVGSALAGL